MKKNHSINKIKKILFKDGYCKIDEFLPKKYCENLIKELIKEKIKLDKNRLHKDEVSKKGQLIIRDLILRNPKIFLNLIDLKIITQVLDSVFNELSGIGPKRKKLLMIHFGSIEKIKNASKQELFSILGIPKSVIIKVYDFFHSH